jgi:hypothetical protein
MSQSTASLATLQGDPIYITRTALADCVFNGQTIELQDRIKQSLPVFDRKARKAFDDPAVRCDVLDLADILPNSLGDLKARKLVAYAAIVGTAGDIVRHELIDIADELRARWRKTISKGAAR